MKEKIIRHEKGRDPLYRTWHASGEHLLMYIHSDGGGSIVSADRVFPMQKGALVFIAAGTHHYTMPDDPPAYDRSKLMILPQTLEKVSGLLNGDTLNRAMVYAVIPEEERAEVEGIFACAHSEAELVRCAALLRLLFYLERYAVESTAAATDTMSRAIRWISENIASDMDIAQICAAVSMSKYHFCRLFKKHTGLTVMQYILKTRLVLARGDLTQTSLSITDISEKNGFSSPSYFCRAFRAEEGISPLHYRKRSLHPPQGRKETP